MRSLFTGFRHIVGARSIVLAGMAGVIMFATAVIDVPGRMALAAPPTPTSEARVQDQSTRIARLEMLFKREVKLLTTEQNRLTKANDLVKKIQQYIDNQKARGKDTTKLGEVLAGLKAAIAAAQSDHDTAKGVLDARAGFDANGKVTDAAQALTTVRTAGKAERQFHRTMIKAGRQLRIAIRQYRRQNSVEPTANKQG